ncbi:MAG: hypothetical protein Q4D38_12305, partial [Planctomycetia bacterium]|nr:hypothetical protein [Planctomycetia bacterium]
KTDRSFLALLHLAAGNIAFNKVVVICGKPLILHGDEGGWRVSGQTQWLWCFATQKETYYSPQILQ